ncbi:unnamed protein product [Polarella glacialis]|uniref:Protein kinase domain-containing protein n=1 Tax=Polarella glacialis TaxID=89957 RepID=A0A813IBH6_POLGL|nr:unnamed protein product [Polarella glacialis]
MRGNLLHELRMMRVIRHPNIVLFYGACIEEESREVALVFEKVSGHTLCAWISQKNPGEDNNNNNNSNNNNR